MHSESQDEIERNAYNAAFYELGFSWYWDCDTYRQLTQRTDRAADRLRWYLETRQPHLLRAYDTTFLVEAIEAAKAEHARRGAVTALASTGQVNWAQLAGCQLGV